MQAIKSLFQLAFTAALVCSLTACSDDIKLKPLPPDSTILAFGDSLTYGTGASLDNSYPAQLAQLTGYQVINAGIPGETSREGLIRLPGLIKQYQPALIILCHGANDILRKMDFEATRQNIQQMITLAKKNNSQVLLIGVPEFGLFLDTAPLYDALAEANHIPIEKNIIGEIIADNSLKSDLIHPNAEGYRMLAKKIIQHLQLTDAIPDS